MNSQLQPLAPHPRHHLKQPCQLRLRPSRSPMVHWKQRGDGSSTTSTQAPPPLPFRQTLNHKLPAHSAFLQLHTTFEKSHKKQLLFLSYLLLERTMPSQQPAQRYRPTHQATSTTQTQTLTTTAATNCPATTFNMIAVTTTMTMTMMLGLRTLTFQSVQRRPCPRRPTSFQRHGSRPLHSSGASQCQHQHQHQRQRKRQHQHQHQHRKDRHQHWPVLPSEPTQERSHHLKMQWHRDDTCHDHRTSMSSC